MANRSRALSVPAVAETIAVSGISYTGGSSEDSTISDHNTSEAPLESMVVAKRRQAMRVADTPYQAIDAALQSAEPEPRGFPVVETGTSVPLGPNSGSEVIGPAPTGLSHEESNL